jgi:hypothetical protein
MTWVLALLERATAILWGKGEKAVPGVRLPVPGCLLVLCSSALFGWNPPPHSFTPVAQSTDIALQGAGSHALVTGKMLLIPERLSHLWHKRSHEGPGPNVHLVRAIVRKKPNSLVQEGDLIDMVSSVPVLGCYSEHCFLTSV